MVPVTMIELVGSAAVVAELVPADRFGPGDSADPDRVRVAIGAGWLMTLPLDLADQLADALIGALAEISDRPVVISPRRR